MQKLDGFYELFERAITCIIMALIALTTVYATFLAGLELVRDLPLGTDFLDAKLLQDTFGSILTVLILLEFNHSIFVSIKEHRSIVEARSIVLIAVIVVARKLILLDYKTATVELIAALGGMALALGALLWLLGRGGSRARSAEGKGASDTQSPR